MSPVRAPDAPAYASARLSSTQMALDAVLDMALGLAPTVPKWHLAVSSWEFLTFATLSVVLVVWALRRHAGPNPPLTNTDARAREQLYLDERRRTAGIDLPPITRLPVTRAVVDAHITSPPPGTRTLGGGSGSGDEGSSNANGSSGRNSGSGSSAGAAAVHVHEKKATGGVGIAFSGGGIRAGAFAVGALKAFADTDQLRKVDYISSVSGGGYTASALFAQLEADAAAHLASDSEAKVDADPKTFAKRAKTALQNAVNAVYERMGQTPGYMLNWSGVWVVPCTRVVLPVWPLHLLHYLSIAFLSPVCAFLLLSTHLVVLADCIAYLFYEELAPRFAAAQLMGVPAAALNAAAARFNVSDIPLDTLSHNIDFRLTPKYLAVQYTAVLAAVVALMLKVMESGVKAPDDGESPTAAPGSSVNEVDDDDGVATATAVPAPEVVDRKKKSAACARTLRRLCSVAAFIFLMNAFFLLLLNLVYIIGTRLPPTSLDNGGSGDAAAFGLHSQVLWGALFMFIAMNAVATIGGDQSVALLYVVGWATPFALLTMCAVACVSRISKAHKLFDRWDVAIYSIDDATGDVHSGPDFFAYHNVVCGTMWVMFFLYEGWSKLLHLYYKYQLSWTFYPPNDRRRSNWCGLGDSKALKFGELSKLSQVGAPYYICNSVINDVAHPGGVNYGPGAFTPYTFGNDYFGQFDVNTMDVSVREAMALSSAAVTPSVGRIPLPGVKFLINIIGWNMGNWLRIGSSAWANPTKLFMGASMIAFSLSPWHGSDCSVYSVMLFGLIIAMYLYTRGEPDITRSPYLRMLVQSFGHVWTRGDGTPEHPIPTHVFASDGGHLDNTALLELLRRRCSVMYAFDGTDDPALTNPDLRVLSDTIAPMLAQLYGVYVEFLVRPNDNTVNIGLLNYANPALANDKRVLTIRVLYRDADGKSLGDEGVLYYIKKRLTVPDNDLLAVPNGVCGDWFCCMRETFPDHPTPNSYFSAETYQKYALLGENAARDALSREQQQRRALQRMERSHRRHLLQRQSPAKAKGADFRAGAADCKDEDDGAEGEEEQITMFQSLIQPLSTAKYMEQKRAEGGAGSAADAAAAAAAAQQQAVSRKLASLAPGPAASAAGASYDDCEGGADYTASMQVAYRNVFSAVVRQLTTYLYFAKWRGALSLSWTQLFLYAAVPQYAGAFLIRFVTDWHSFSQRGPRVVYWVTWTASLASFELAHYSLSAMLDGNPDVLRRAVVVFNLALNGVSALCIVGNLCLFPLRLVGLMKRWTHSQCAWALFLGVVLRAVHLLIPISQLPAEYLPEWFANHRGYHAGRDLKIDVGATIDTIMLSLAFYWVMQYFNGVAMTFEDDVAAPSSSSLAMLDARRSTSRPRPPPLNRLGSVGSKYRGGSAAVGVGRPSLVQMQQQQRLSVTGRAHALPSPMDAFYVALSFPTRVGLTFVTHLLIDRSGVASSTPLTVAFLVLSVLWYASPAHPWGILPFDDRLRDPVTGRAGALKPPMLQWDVSDPVVPMCIATVDDTPRTKEVKCLAQDIADGKPNILTVPMMPVWYTPVPSARKED